MSATPYERVRLARDNQRPTGQDYIKNIFKNCLTLNYIDIECVFFFTGYLEFDKAGCSFININGHYYIVFFSHNV